METTTLRPVSRVASVPAAAAPLAARHFLARLAFETDPSDLHADLVAGVPGLVVVDTRAPDAYEASHVPGAVNLPHATIDEVTAGALDPAALYVTYCWGPACNASTKGAAALASLGFRVKELIGGLSAWQAEGFESAGTATGPVDEATFACAC
jgi:rhodanese-related sulfurtransferase